MSFLSGWILKPQVLVGDTLTVEVPKVVSVDTEVLPPLDCEYFEPPTIGNEHMFTVGEYYIELKSRWVRCQNSRIEWTKKQEETNLQNLQNAEEI